MTTKYIKKNDIDSVIQQAINKICTHKRTIDSETGWHQHLGSNKIGIVASSIGVQLLTEKTKKYNITDFENVLDMIKKKQHKDGGWGYISNSSDISNIDATCWALLALNLKKESYSENIKNGIEWIFSQKNKNNNGDEAWGFIIDNQSRTYNTATVIRTIYTLNITLIDEEREKFQSSIMWLISSQNKVDGGWGEIRGSQSTIFHTSYVLYILSFCRIDLLTKEKRDKALSFLRQKVDSYQKLQEYRIIGSCEYIDVIANDINNRFHIYHFSIPYLINAFIYSGEKDHEIVFWGVQYLIKNCNDGIWQHPYLEETSIKPIWAIYDGISALLNFKNQYKQWKNISYFKLNKNKKVMSRNCHFKLKSLLFFERNSKKIKYAIFFLLIFISLMIFPFIKEYIYELLKSYSFPSWFINIFNKYENAFNNVSSIIANILCSIIATYIYSLINRKKIKSY